MELAYYTLTSTVTGLLPDLRFRQSFVVGVLVRFLLVAQCSGEEGGGGYDERARRKDIRDRSGCAGLGCETRYRAGGRSGAADRGVREVVPDPSVGRSARRGMGVSGVL